MWMLIKTALYIQPAHFELLYHENYHYDAVVAEETGRVNNDSPILTGATDIELV